MEHTTTVCEDCGGSGYDLGALGPHDDAVCTACNGSGVEPEAEQPEPPPVVWGRHIDPLMPAIERFMTRPRIERKPPAAELHPVFAEILTAFQKGAK